MRGNWTLSVVLVVLYSAAAAGEEGLVRLSQWSGQPSLLDDPVFQPASAWAPHAQTPLHAQAPLPAQAPLSKEPAGAWPAPGACDDCCLGNDVCRLPCVYAQADGLFWHRVGAGCNEVLLINTTDDSTLATTSDLDFNLTGGMRFLVGWQPGGIGCEHCCAWELSYFGIFNWNADAVFTGAGDLAIPGDLGLNSNNFFGADEIALRYQAEMHNVELNCVKSCCLSECMRIDFLTGFRYISLDEDFTITATDLQEGTSSYTVNADNDLFGLQLGGRLTRGWCRWQAELTGKAAVFYNDAHQVQLATDFPNTPSPFVLRDARGDSDGVAMLGELGVVLIRPINDCWSLRVGYSVLGLGGVALAPDQLDFTDTFGSGTGLDRHGWILAHGGLVGVQASW